MRWWFLGFAIVVAVGALACGNPRPNDYKGRPVPRTSVTCWDNSTQKNVGPWACDNHGGDK
jgi:hypothetical protein